MKKPAFIICAPIQLVDRSNGVLALVHLARELERCGRSAYICAIGDTPKEIMLKIDFDTFVPKNEVEVQFVNSVLKAREKHGFKLLTDFSQENIDASYVVYPEVLINNALQAKQVIRYFLNRDGLLKDGTKVNVGPNDFTLAHSKVMYAEAQHVCFFAYMNPLFQRNATHFAENRTMDLTYLGKGAGYGVTGIVDNTVAITRNWPETKEQLAIMLRNCRFFYTADACSGITDEALACGAVPVFLHNGPWTDAEIDGSEHGAVPRLRPGVAVNTQVFAEFEAERAAYLERIAQCIRNWGPRVQELIEKVDRHFAAL